MLKNIVRNTTTLFSGEVVARVCHFVTVVYIARVLGAAGFGAINFSLALLSYFFMVTNLGLGEIGVREVSRKKDIKDVAETIISMRIGLAAASFIALVVIACFNKGSTDTGYLVIAYGMTLFPYAMSLEWVFRGVEKMKYNALGRIMNAVFYMALVLLLVKGVRDILKVAFITIFADFVTSVFFYAAFSRKFGPIRLHLDPRRWYDMGRVSTQLFLSSGMLIFYTNFGTIALGFLKGERSVGIYGAASKLIFFVYAISDLFVAATFPVLSRLYHESKEKLGEFMGYCCKITVLAGLPVVAGGTILGPKIIRLVYGASYDQSGPIFQILSWFVAVNLVGFVLSYALVACDRQHIYLRLMALGAAVNVVVNLALISSIGMYAPACALVLTESIVLVGAVVALKGIVRLPPIALYGRPLAAAAVMGIALLLCLKLHVLILIPLAAAAYLAALFAFGGITMRDIAKIREALA